MNRNLQLTFDFMKEKHSKDGINKKNITAEALKDKDYRRFVIGWLLKSKPLGIGYEVPTRVISYKASIAAFWSKVEGKNGKKTLIPYKTTIIEVRSSREDSIYQCFKNGGLKRLLTQEKKNKIKLESTIRKEEPYLKSTDNLFSDIDSWEYRKTKNQDYLKCCLNIEKLERSINKGSYFEKIRQSKLADYLYLAVPYGLVKADEIEEGWGLLYINNDTTVDVISHPENWECPIENKFHLIQNIAKSNIRPICFANGIKLNDEEHPKFIRRPRQRRN